jgi:hypothetical protein
LFKCAALRAPVTVLMLEREAEPAIVSAGLSIDVEFVFRLHLSTNTVKPTESVDVGIVSQVAGVGAPGGC